MTAASKTGQIVGDYMAFLVLCRFPCLTSDRSYPTAKLLGAMFHYYDAVFHIQNIPMAWSYLIAAVILRVPHSRNPDSAHNVAESVFSSTATQGSSLKGVDDTGSYLHPRVRIPRGLLRPVCYVAFASVLGTPPRFRCKMPIWGKMESNPWSLTKSFKGRRMSYFSLIFGHPFSENVLLATVYLPGSVGSSHHDVVRDLRVKAYHNDDTYAGGWPSLTSFVSLLLPSLSLDPGSNYSVLLDQWVNDLGVEGVGIPETSLKRIIPSTKRHFAHYRIQARALSVGLRWDERSYLIALALIVICTSDGRPVVA
ncbi:hypothetical protein EDD15DRAFT_2192853 [Pisolithus albus]|nr:hypothetical protein EDD15DRAFT_2192853 [Pisolithus albus]